MKHLVVVRHSISKQEPRKSSHEWTLTDEGQVRLALLANSVEKYKLSKIFAGTEPKMQQTGQGLASKLDIPVEIAPDLHETLRDTAPYFEDVDQFRAAIKAAMDEPEGLLYGEETFDDAYTRFNECVRELTVTNPNQSIGVVTGGTVLALFIHRKSGLDTYKVWRSLTMPCYAVFTLPDLNFLELVTEPFKS
ncbi:MAG: histidine phosphatase family protein [Anaerolineaceae bacterium]|nr:histidine phosphatase family protein [Anaerolineaceae bacterium]